MYTHTHREFRTKVWREHSFTHTQRHDYMQTKGIHTHLTQANYIHTCSRTQTHTREEAVSCAPITLIQLHEAQHEAEKWTLPLIHLAAKSCNEKEPRWETQIATVAAGILCHLKLNSTGSHASSCAVKTGSERCTHLSQATVSNYLMLTV